MRGNEPREISRWILVIIFGMAALALAAAGYWYYLRQAEAIRTNACNELKAVADLKISQISAWRKERLTDARLNSSGVTKVNILKWLPTMHDIALKAAIVTRLDMLVQSEDYQNIIVAAPDGRLLLSCDPDLRELDAATRELVAQAASSRQLVFGDFFSSAVSNHVYLEITAPILNAERRPEAVLILRTDPETSLYPLMRIWPLPSRSGESLLVRRDATDVVFLNPLRHRSDLGLTRHISLSRSDVPSVQAALGRTGVFEGVDYRGVRVLAYLQPVPGSPWFMVAKEDSNEILEEVRYREGVVLLLVVLGILTTSSLAAFVYNNRQRRLYRALLQAEVQRREAQEEIRATLYGIGDGVIATDVNGRVTRMNPIAETLTGWTETEGLGKPLYEVFQIIDEETRATARNPVASVLGEGLVVGLANHTVLIARDGTEYPIADSGAPIRSELGTITGVVLVFRDQTAERTTQKALQESEARLRRVIEGTNVGTWEWNVQNGEMLVNERWAEMLGYTLAELNPAGTRVWLDMVHPEDLTKLQAELKEEHLRRHSLYDVECRMRHRDGHWVWIHDRGRVIEQTDDGKPARMAGTRTDITERRTLENQFRQAQKMESVGRLAGGVAHDFNNMLSVILGHTEIAIELVESAAPVRADLIEIQKAALHSADLTRQLLAFARKQAVNPRVLDLNETVSNMVTMLQRLIGEDVELVWRPGPELWTVKIDPTQVHQILANLSVNARDAIAGVGTLTLETGNVQLDETFCATHVDFVPGDYVLLAVSDTGTGMGKETLEHLFEPFFTTKAIGKGTGLGLATVYGVVKQNQGFINVYSEIGYGTSFKIYLPKAATLTTTASTNAVLPGQGTETVLLAEDEKAILALGTTILQKYGYKVLAARTPVEALNLARQHVGPIHLLITDVVMPGMNGKKLKDKLTAIYPGIKVLFMSGYTADVIDNHGVIDEGIDFLQKPFSAKTLARRVHEVLRQRPSGPQGTGLDTGLERLAPRGPSANSEGADQVPHQPRQAGQLDG